MDEIDGILATDPAELSRQIESLSADEGGPIDARFPELERAMQLIDYHHAAIARLQVTPPEAMQVVARVGPVDFELAKSFDDPARVHALILADQRVKLVAALLELVDHAASLLVDFGAQGMLVERINTIFEASALPSQPHEPDPVAGLLPPPGP